MSKELKKCLGAYPICLLLLFPFVSPGSPPAFNQDIRPILADNCFQCHGPDSKERKADLRLDSKPSDFDWEGLLAKVTTEDPEERMPPPKTGKRLTAPQVSLIRQWVDAGAKYQGHWAFEPVSPGKYDSIDGHILVRLEEKGLGFSGEAPKAVVLRRVTFGLTGLPPTWEEVQNFVNDDSPDAYEKVVDRLLASPSYGEHWGRHWLDLARYADTHGGSAIGFKKFPFSYTYRDYVIQALNNDVPYDRFILEQIAADQLGLPENDPALAGLGFLTVGRKYRNRHDRLDDRIDVITRGLQGLTVACARCHDHKFDPIPTTDYYSIHAALANSRIPNELPLVGTPSPNPGYWDKLAGLEAKRDDMIREQGEVFRGRLRMQTGLYFHKLARGDPEEDTSTTFLSYRTEDYRPVVQERWRRYIASMPEDDPVFGPWHKLCTLPVEGFASKCQGLVEELQKDNGDPKKFSNEHSFSTQPPKWNPRILDALAEAKPESFVGAAEAYGKVFTGVELRWHQSLLDAIAEAAPGGKLIPDQDARHKVVNSSIERQLRHHLHSPESPTSITFDDYRELGMLNRGLRDSVRSTVDDITNLNHSANAPARSMALEELPGPTEDYVFLRGNPVAKGETVQPGFLSILEGKAPAILQDRKRRLGLANSIVAETNPLTRRVIVNWVWQHHFGTGLARTPDDFGTRSEPPTHPALLDFLATSLLDDNWSLKHLHRRILLSRTYRQSSATNPDGLAKDPGNRFLWRMPPQRLGMESMRDSMFFASGELDRKMGGKPFGEPDKEIPRRSVYAFLNRDVLSRMATTFNGADPSACTVKRPNTMVPQQTLFALNSNFVMNRARALAKLPGLQKAKTFEDKLACLYHHTYSRDPDPQETQLALEYLQTAQDKDAAWEQIAHALLASNEFHFVD